MGSQGHPACGPTAVPLCSGISTGGCDPQSDILVGVEVPPRLPGPQHQVEAILQGLGEWGVSQAQDTMALHPSWRGPCLGLGAPSVPQDSPPLSRTTHGI